MTSIAATTNQRFDTLLRAMLGVTEEKKTSGDQASNAADDACCGDIQTPPDTSEDAVR